MELTPKALCWSRPVIGAFSAHRRLHRDCQAHRTEKSLDMMNPQSRRITKNPCLKLPALHFPIAGLLWIDQQFFKDVVKEILQRLVAPVGLRSQQRALPAIEEEAGQCLGPGSGRQVALLSGFLYHRSDGRLPAREVGAKTALQQRTRACRLEAQLTQEAARDRCCLSRSADQILEVATQPPQRLLSRVPKDLTAMGPLEGNIAFQHRGGELFFAAEVMVKRALGHTGSIQNLLQAG